MPRLLATVLNVTTILIASAALAKILRVERLVGGFVEHEIEVSKLTRTQWDALCDQVQLLQAMSKGPDKKAIRHEGQAKTWRT